MCGGCFLTHKCPHFHSPRELSSDLGSVVAAAAMLIGKTDDRDHDGASEARAWSLERSGCFGVHHLSFHNLMRPPSSLHIYNIAQKLAEYIAHMRNIFRSLFSHQTFQHKKSHSAKLKPLPCLFDSTVSGVPHIVGRRCLQSKAHFHGGRCSYDHS